MPDNPQSMARKPTVLAGRRVYAVGDVHGRLTALVLEGSERRFLQARDEAEAIHVVRMSESEVSGGL